MTGAEPPSPSPAKDQALVRRALDTLILSPSGWRAVFAPGGEDSPAPDPGEGGLLLAALAGLAFAAFAGEKTRRSPRIILGRDARPTGRALGGILLRALEAGGGRCLPVGLCAAPCLMARTQGDPRIDGFAYVSASHNPLGHNGFKFALNLPDQPGEPFAGGDRGGVLSPAMEGELRRRFLALAEDPAALEAARRLLSLLPPGEWGRPREKRRTLGAYRNLSLGIAGDKKTLRSLKTALKGRPLGILGELNGSARGAGIDASFLARLGVRPRILNGVPGQVVHRIVPEGESLDLCCRELEKLRKGDPSFQLGYVPDNDGDRGNLVYFDTREGRAKALGAQEVFALSVLGVLAWEKLRSPAPPEALALVVNGPTSLRIDYLAARWGARVFRGEVGEANMINLARQLRAQGWRVPVLGEGSNGGNITYPATVRDPLNTLIALIRLLRLPALNPGGEPRELPDLLESLPAFTTSSAFEEAAVLPLRAENPGELKGRYEEIFLKDWEARREVLASWGLDHFKEFNYEGTEEREGWGPGFRRGRQTGGLKIQFYGPPEEPPRGFLWFRGSGTEPVLRIMADIQGRDNRRMAELLAWQRDMILRAFQKLG